MGKDMDADWKSSNIKMEIRVNLAGDCPLRLLRSYS